MDRNTKLLSAISLLIVTLGLSLLWFGLKPVSISEHQQPITPTITQVTKQATSAAVVGEQGQRVKVAKVIDGDTVEIETGAKVRFIGIDTPETVDPRRPVGCFGKEASYETKGLLEGKAVVLEKDVSETDKFGRLLRYVYLPLDNGELLFINDYLVREGFAKASTYPPDVKFTGRFLEAERQAKENKKGLWGKC